MLSSSTPTRCRPAAARAGFADSSHLRFYGASPVAAGRSPPPARRRTALPTAAFAGEGSPAAAAPASRRARVLQQVAEVDATMRLLEEAGPLEVAQLSRAMARRARASTSSSSLNSSSSSSSESSESSSESEAESAVAARMERRLRAQQQLFAQQVAEPEAAAAAIMAAASSGNNIVPSTLSPAAPAPAAASCSPPAAATVVRVCTGKKCAAAGSAAVLAQLAAQPGVVAQPTKCLKQCKRCVVAEMATVGASGGCAALYTGLNASNATGVLAMHRQQQPSPARR